MPYLLKAHSIAGDVGLVVGDVKTWAGWTGGPGTTPAGKKIDAGIPVGCDSAPRSAQPAWDEPFNGLVPHIFELVYRQYVVSNGMRQVIEEHAPGCCQFFPFSIDAELADGSPKSFFYMDVIERAQRLDWMLSSTSARSNPHPDGRSVLLIEPRRNNDGYVFKAAEIRQFSMWREQDVSDAKMIKFVLKGNIYISKALWGELNARFPGCLEPIWLREN